MENIHPLAVRDDASDTPSPPLAFDPVSVAYRSDGWTPEKQRQFIEELADCGLVSEAASRVGMSERSANRLRYRADAGSFALAWDAAVSMGGDRLRSVAFDRAVNGSPRRRYYHGKVIDEERVYDNRLLTYLLGRHPKPRFRNWECDAFLANADHGLPAPDTHGKPVWHDGSSVWYTCFPPPDDFAGIEYGTYGDKDYSRTLSESEQAALEAVHSRRREREARARDLYFERLR